MRASSPVWRYIHPIHELAAVVVVPQDRFMERQTTRDRPSDSHHFSFCIVTYLRQHDSNREKFEIHTAAKNRGLQIHFAEQRNGGQHHHFTKDRSIQRSIIDEAIYLLPFFLETAVC